MKTILKLLIITIAWGFPRMELLAQQDLLSAGGDASGTGGTVSWSVGLTAYSSWSNIPGSLSEGVQQPYEIFIMPGLQEFDPSPKCTLFPNPTTGNSTLKFLDPDLRNLSAAIYDLEGTLLRNIEISSEETSITMDDLPSTSYFLVVFEINKPIKTFKIIKK